MGSIDNHHESSGTSSELSVGDGTDFRGSQNNNWLCGRTTETLTLLKTYQAILQSSNGPLSKAVLLVHGESGSGKTCLVDSLREPVFASNGYFCSGKFFQPTEGGASGILVSQEPYSAILAAFSDLCDLVLQSRDFDNELRLQIQGALGADASLLARAISNLSPFLNGYNDDETHFGLFDTTNKTILTRFKIACRRFLRAMSSERHPIVLFIDDVQWMDDGSRQVIKALLDDGELQNVLLIFAYRDEEGDSIGDLFCGSPGTVDIPVQNLDVRDVQQLVSALLGSPASQIQELADLVVSRTLGNPFHVIQFIESIQNEELLVYNTARSMWTFDVGQIKKELMVSETLCDLLARRICQLDPAMQVVLKIASLIGYCFAKDVLMAVSSIELHEKQLTSDQPGSNNVALVESVLEMAISQGFIDKTKDLYNFTHDKLQASCQDMIEPEDVPRLHYLIGNQYVFHCKTEDALFHAAVHLNKAGDYALDKERRDKLARINLEAAKRCRDKSAFNDAAQFLRHGLKLLDEEPHHSKWTKSFDLAYELTESLARMELILGNLNACQERNQELLLRSKSVQMKIAPLVIDVEVRMAGNDTTETVVAAKRALRELGVVMPRRVTVLSLLLKLRKVRHLLRGKKDDDILSLPLMRDQIISTAIKLLIHLSLFCFLQDESIAALYSALCATELTMKKSGGLSPYSANCFTIYGIAEVGLGNIHQGVRFGELAMKLLDRIPCKEAICPVIYLSTTLLLHWKTHISSLVPVLGKGLSSGFEVGDVVYCSLCIFSDIGIRYMMGENLASLEQCMRTYYSRLCDLGQDAIIQWIQPWMQFILNMRTSTTSWVALTILSGEVMDESEFMKDAIASNHTVLLRNVFRHKSTLAYHFGCYEMAVTIYEKMNLIGRVYESTVGAAPYHFYGALIFYERYRTTRQVKHLKAARKHLRRLKQFEAVGNPNVATFFILLQAEKRALGSRDVSVLVSVYTAAIDAMKAEGFVHLEALANERLSVILSALGRHELSIRYFDRALNLYSDWGAIAKYEWLLVQRSLRLNAGNSRRMITVDEIHV